MKYIIEYKSSDDEYISHLYFDFLYDLKIKVSELMSIYGKDLQIEIIEGKYITDIVLNNI